MATVWQPPDISTTCLTNTNLTSCSLFGTIYLNLLVNLYAGSEDLRIQEERRRKGRKEKDDDNEEYDFIVVGAGTAGCVVANRLTEVDDWKVLLLEAGPEQPDITMVPGLINPILGSNIDWKYTVQSNGKSCLAMPNQQCGWPRGKVMGGTGSLNSMTYVRGNRIDYNGWNDMGNYGWNYKDVLPYFKKFEDNLNIESLDREYHGARGPQPIARFPFIDLPSIALTTAFNELGLPMVDINGAEQIGAIQGQAFSEDGKRVSSNDAYIRPIRYKRKNLTVKPNSEVVKVLTDKLKRAYGVQYIKNGKLHVAIAKREVIVSGGTINSAKLLLLSGIGPKKQLKKLHIPVVEDLPVGENLQDHPVLNGIIIAFSNDTATLVEHKEILRHVREYKDMEVKRGPLSSTGIVQFVGFLKTDKKLPAPNIQMQPGSIVLKEYLAQPLEYSGTQVLPSSFYDAIILRIQNLAPRSRGRIVLNETDPNAPPLMYGNYLDDPKDLEPIKAAFKIVRNIENTEIFRSGQAKLIKKPLQACKYTAWGSDQYVECMARQYTFGASHQVGTCKMGPKWDKTAVVDSRLRVYGVPGLRVIDASIIPLIIRGNTNGPVLMVAEKGADMIKEDWDDEKDDSLKD